MPRIGARMPRRLPAIRRSDRAARTMQSIARSTSGGRDRRPTALVHGRRRLPRLASVRAAARARATRCCASTTSSPARAATSQHLLDNPRFELMRHDVTFPLYVEVDEIYNLACPASPVHYQRDPVQTTKTSVHGAINMLGLAKRAARPRSCRRRPARSTATPTCTRSPRTTGATSTRSARAPATTRASAAPRRCSSTTAASTACAIKVARIFNTYGPRMHPNDGRVVSNFIVQALRGEDITIYGDGTPDALVLLRRRPGRRPDAADGRPPTTSPARSTSATRRVHDARARREGDRADRLALADRASSRCRRTIRAAPARHRAGARAARLGADASRSSEGLDAHDRLFRKASCGGTASGRRSSRAARRGLTTLQQVERYVSGRVLNAGCGSRAWGGRA